MKWLVVYACPKRIIFMVISVANRGSHDLCFYMIFSRSGRGWYSGCDKILRKYNVKGAWRRKSILSSRSQGGGSGENNDGNIRVALRLKMECSEPNVTIKFSCSAECQYSESSVCTRSALGKGKATLSHLSCGTPAHVREQGFCSTTTYLTRPHVDWLTDTRKYWGDKTCGCAPYWYH